MATLSLPDLDPGRSSSVANALSLDDGYKYNGNREQLFQSGHYIVDNTICAKSDFIL